jgi:hypothetical protein
VAQEAQRSLRDIVQGALTYKPTPEEVAAAEADLQAQEEAIRAQFRNRPPEATISFTNVARPPSTAAEPQS